MIPAGDRTYQQRSYRLEPEHMDTFLSIWTTRVVPMRERHGLHTLTAWVSKDRDRFDWITYVEEGDDFAAVEAAYFASDERRTLDPDPAQYLLEMDLRFVDPVLFDNGSADAGAHPGGGHA